MKNLKEILIESASYVTNKDMNKFNKYMSEERKVKNYIKKNSSGDIDDIYSAMRNIHNQVSYYDEAQHIENFGKYIEEAGQNLYDIYDRPVADVAIKIYKSLFKEIIKK